MRVHVALTLLLVGCVTESNVVEKMGAAACRRELECHQADFESSYDSVGDCVVEYADSADDWQACAIESGCVFDPEQADGCLEAVHQETCEAYDNGEHGNACDEIYRCTNGQLYDVGVCMLGG